MVGIFLPLMILALGAVWQTTQSERTRMEGRLVDQARALAAGLDGEFAGAEVYLRAVAASPSLAAEDWLSLYQQARRSARPGSFVAILDSDGRRVLNTYFSIEQGGVTLTPTSGVDIARRALAALKKFSRRYGTGSSPASDRAARPPSGGNGRPRPPR